MSRWSRSSVSPAGSGRKQPSVPCPWRESSHLPAPPRLRVQTRTPSFAVPPCLCVSPVPVPNIPLRASASPRGDPCPAPLAAATAACYNARHERSGAAGPGAVQPVLGAGFDLVGVAPASAAKAPPRLEPVRSWWRWPRWTRPLTIRSSWPTAASAAGTSSPMRYWWPRAFRPPAPWPPWASAPSR